MSGPSLVRRGGGAATAPDSPDHGLDLLPVLEVDLAAVLGPHQHGGKAERRVPEAGAVALDHSRRQDGHHVWR